MNEKQSTPLMKQYFAIKQEYGDCLLFFQVGDFYELFFEDAQRAAAFLGITLTSRGKLNDEPIPLCGVPVHTVDFYLHKLIKGGFKVAVCDQTEPPTPGKVVNRAVRQVLTPGTLVNPTFLDEKSSSYILCYIPAGSQGLLLFSELLTAQLFATYIPGNIESALEPELIRFIPDEVIIPLEAHKAWHKYFSTAGYSCAPVSCMAPDYEYTQAWMAQHEQGQSVSAARALCHEALTHLYSYIKRNQAATLDSFGPVQWYSPEDFVMLDPNTQKNLEIVRSLHTGSRSNTLLEAMDASVTPMGSRMIKKWLLKPLRNQEAIEQRLDMVELFKQQHSLLLPLKQSLAHCGDVERIIGRIALAKGQPTDYIKLLNVLATLPTLWEKSLVFNAEQVQQLLELCLHFEPLHHYLHSAFMADVTATDFIKAGFDSELDRLRAIVNNSTELILALEQEEQKKSGINSLKIVFNTVQGYSFEVTKANTHLVPDYFIRHQTLVGKERYTTVALKKLEAEVNNARDNLAICQQRLFEIIKQRVHGYHGSLRKMAHMLGVLDALLSFADIAYRYNYVRPTFNTQRSMQIKQGKHPIIERVLNHHCIANDSSMNAEQPLWIITGPNMGGKSTFLRQVALITLLAHAGSFVPAQAAHIALVDRIFTRIGSGDDVAGGKSTFLVEMEEAALICNHATSNSLVILDEVGRGTSTDDGMAIAHAIIEYIYTRVQALCLFATHYHELTALTGQYPGIVCYYAASKKIDNRVVLLYKMVQGVADGSFGIEVARMAHLPDWIVTRARELIVQWHEGQRNARSEALPSFRPAQIDHNADYKPIIEALRAVNIDDISPRQAWEMIATLKQSMENN